MTTNPPTRLPLHTVEDLFDKLKWDLARLSETWGTYESYNFIVTAHHLYYDWITQPNSPATADQRDRANQLPANAKDVFQAITDMSNGCKHWQLTNKSSLNRQVVSFVTEPMCSGWDSYFEGDMVHIEFSQYFVSMGELSALVMEYFEWIVFGKSTKSLVALHRGYDRLLEVGTG